MTTAVYLIIAGALLGPIEAQPDRGSKVAEQVGQYAPFTQGAAIASCSHAFPDDPSRCLSGLLTYESADKTCERAMKEVGAHSGVWQDRPGNDRVFYGRDGNGPQFELGGSQVFCIPAPSGLKR